MAQGQPKPERSRSPKVSHVIPKTGSRRTEIYKSKSDGKELCQKEDTKVVRI